LDVDKLRAQLEDLQHVRARCVSLEASCAEQKQLLSEKCVVVARLEDERKMKEDEWMVIETQLQGECADRALTIEEAEKRCAQLRDALSEMEMCQLTLEEEKEQGALLTASIQRAEEQTQKSLQDMKDKQKKMEKENMKKEEEMRRKMEIIETEQEEWDKALKMERAKWEKEWRHGLEERRLWDSSKRLFESEKAKWEREKTQLLENVSTGKKKLEDDKRAWKHQTARWDDEREKHVERTALWDQERTKFQGSIGKIKKQLDKIAHDPRIAMKQCCDSVTRRLNFTAQLYLRIILPL